MKYMVNIKIVHVFPADHIDLLIPFGVKVPQLAELFFLLLSKVREILKNDGCVVVHWFKYACFYLGQSHKAVPWIGEAVLSLFLAACPVPEHSLHKMVHQNSGASPILCIWQEAYRQISSPFRSFGYGCTHPVGCCCRLPHRY